jgi:hypothetical protein
MPKELDLNQSREAAMEALKKLGVELRQLEPFRGVKPVETALEIKQIMLSREGSLSDELAKALELVITPPKYVYSMTIRFASGWGGYSPNIGDIGERNPDNLLTKPPANARKAIEIGVNIARTMDDRATEGGFSTVDVSCFPFEWQWGKDPGEPIFGE